MSQNTIQTSLLQPGTLALIGIPLDENSSFRKGPALAPDRIRESFFSDSSNLWTENSIDLGQNRQWIDLGNITDSDGKLTFGTIETAVKKILVSGARLISLGGDHSITYPIIRSFAEKYKDLNILHLDAHPDLYDEINGNRFSHGCPFARIMEEKLVGRIVQAGIRTLNGHQREQASAFGVEIIQMKDGLEPLKQIHFEGPIYLSIDLDCLDPAFAPGVSHHEPGGLTTREVIQIIHQLEGDIVGADIVEYNPDRDFISVTSMVAAKLLKEIMGRMISLR